MKEISTQKQTFLSNLLEVLAVEELKLELPMVRPSFNLWGKLWGFTFRIWGKETTKRQLQIEVNKIIVVNNMQKARAAPV